ncbi:phage tail protein [Agrobacterium tumefaciens]|uniref:phage tail protein n=1 Tax=Agrobacterium tumefaciens TaxID=358 RepID=UPI001CBAFD45|nr:phage tail protein [Agrobacterium tumefaciens]MDP9875633.1 hypothetical protein [Agrobacterium tumefaciens]MDP9980548.1 hypothetical protein [Agrobacterium tumefaciens]
MGFLAPVVSFVGGILGTGLGKMLVGLGLNLIVSKMEERRAKKAQAAAAGTKFDRDYGENVSRKVACGPVAIAGHDCYVNTWEQSNRNLEQVYVFSDFPCDGLVRIWAGGSQLNLTTADNKRYEVATGDYAGRMFFTFYDGTQAAADGAMIAHSNPPGRWTQDHIGVGICWLKVELIYDQEKLNQFPDFFFEFRGARLYDFRKDSSIGGNGNHRWGDYSTYEYTENPIIMDYNYCRGFSWNGDLFLGMDMPASDLPFDRYVMAANLADEFADYGRRYRCSILLDADLDHGDNLDALMLSCGGIRVDGVEGSWPIIGSEQPIVFTFTDDDLVRGEKVRFRKRRSMGDLVNAVSGTYQEPGNMWSPAGYDVQTSTAMVEIDRRTRDVPLSFPMVFSKGQANQLASIYLNENRYEATAEVVLRPGFRNIKAGDWGFWDSRNEKRRGVYMVQGRSISALDSNGPRNVALSLQERNGLIYKAVGVIPPTVPIPNDQPIYLNELQDFAVTPVLGIGADGRSYPAFRLSWAKIEDVTIRAIDFEYWLKSEPQNVIPRTVTADKLVALLQEGVLSLSDYQFRYKFVADRPTSWTQPITVRSLDGGNADLEIGLGQVRKDISDRLLGLQADIDNLWQQVDSVSMVTSTTDTVDQLERQAMRAQLGSSIASIIRESEVRATQMGAMARRVDGVRAEMGDVLADGYLSMTAQTTGDVLSRVEIAARARKGEQAALAALILRVFMENGVLKTENILSANRTIFVDENGQGGQQIVVFDQNGVRLAVANIGTVNAGLLQSPNGKMQINLSAGTIVIRS